MVHEWKDIMLELSIPERLSIEGARRCQLCGVEQKKEPQGQWLRITHYRWEPPVPRSCVHISQ